MKTKYAIIIKYVFLIDTDEYAGNFERAMCAYCTGMLGECKVGKEEKDKFRQKYGLNFMTKLSEMIESRPDDNGTHRPTTIYSTPGYFNNGMGEEYKEEEWKEGMNKYPAYQSVGIFFNVKPSQEIIEMIKERAEEFTHGIGRIGNKQRTMKILGFRMIKETLTKEEIKI